MARVTLVICGLQIALKTPNFSYWIESVSGATPNQTATVWVKVTDSLDSNVSIYAYYGNASATYNNSTGGNNTFIFFDDFSGDLSKWTKHKELGTITLTGGYVECGGGVSWHRDRTLQQRRQRPTRSLLLLRYS